MPDNVGYQTSSSVNEGILEIIFTGEVTKDTVEKLANEGLFIIIENGLKNVLVDVRALKGRLGIMDTYSIVRNPSEKPSMNCALVDLPAHEEYIKFLETTAINAGHSLRCFTDIDAARAWLNSKKKKS
jgi:hypothetical protein